MLGLVCTPIRWIAIAVQRRTDTVERRAAQDTAFRQAIAACRAWTDDTDHITIVRNRGNLFD